MEDYFGKSWYYHEPWAEDRERYGGSIVILHDESETLLVSGACPNDEAVAYEADQTSVYVPDPKEVKAVMKGIAMLPELLAAAESASKAWGGGLSIDSLEGRAAWVELEQVLVQYRELRPVAEGRG